MNLQRCCCIELVGWQFCATLIEVVCDPHRTDRVRARWPRSHLVELVDDRHHGPFLFLYNLEGWRKRHITRATRHALRFFARGYRRFVRLGRGTAASDDT